MTQTLEAEPFRIKVVEPLKITTRQERQITLNKAYYNIFSIPSEEVFVDLLTDSGTSAMSHYQWAGLMTGDESYAGCRNWFHLEETVKEITGYQYVLPTHQGRPAENILTSILLRPGKAALSNMLFDTTHAHVENKQALPVNLVTEQGLQPEIELPFKGNVDIERMEAYIQEHGQHQVGMILVTITCNNNAGQPVSMENLRAVRAVADKYGLPFYLDAARFAENAYFIQQREPGYAQKSVKQIAREMFSLADGCTMSSKKDGLVNIGGFLATNDEAIYRSAQQHLILLEGFLTYGGMAGRDLEALSIGLTEVLDESYLANRVRQVHYFGSLLQEAGVPLVLPLGGHCVVLDMKRFLPHIPQEQFPAEAFLAALYLDSGTRAVGLGQLMFGSENPESGVINYAPLEVVRMAVPRRVYTDNHLRLVANSVIRIYEKREQIKGMKIIWAPTVLRHFTAQLAPVG